MYGMPRVLIYSVGKHIIKAFNRLRLTPFLFLPTLYFPIAPTQANTGTMSFNATIQVPSCTVAATGSATGSGNNIRVNFGDVPMTQLQPGNTWVVSHGRVFRLLVTCPGAMTGFMRARSTFTAASGGSGTDLDDPRLLRLTAGSTARGVAVGIWQSGAGAPLDLSTNPSLTGDFSQSGGNAIAEIRLSTLYSRTSGAPRAGSALAALPFTLTYE
jgi:type 1 fimbria pilin